ncbi:uncharacterized protein LOC6033254 [Culex quinquefasciatus]|uniref:uncharacterized protein LOC6033254 n=1 Tax=Culex quinquefasciatus TaxID=7176 RepID=UPI0018E2CE03|nr:uncharacterized protein LOC6033254 [Culex quinquefasciatus]
MIVWDSTFFCALLSFLHLSKATLSIDFDEDIRDCDNETPMPGIDTSNFQILPQPDGSITVNGTARFTKDYGNPTRWKFYTKRLERGRWIPGIVSRDISNVCSVLQMPYELWYPFTRLMQRKFCPFKAGHEEHMNNVNIGNLAKTFEVSPDFIGEWRVYHAITTTRNGRPFDECFMVSVSVSEV